jgi:hypothetical protein
MLLLTDTKAFESMVKLHANGDRDDPQVLIEFNEITQTIAYEKENTASWKSLVSPGKLPLLSQVEKFLADQLSHSTSAPPILNCRPSQHILPNQWKRLHAVIPAFPDVTS